jgi:CubicO group peptidase (beta-lactamase class C family)
MTTTGFTNEGLAALHNEMEGYVDRGEVAGIVTGLQCDGDPMIDAVGVQDLASGAPMRPDSIFRIASMTKAVTAVAALQLREAGAFTMDDPVERWLPELTNPRVLRTPESEMDDTEPAARAIVIRDLFRYTLGTGALLLPPGTTPIQRAMEEAGVAPGGIPPAHDPDTWMSIMGNLPLIHQPGADWMYNAGSEFTGVLIERITGKDLGTVFAERIFEPLGMVDTGFSVPQAKQDRFATAYRIGDANALEVVDDPRSGHWSSPPPFRSGTGGLVSTASDYLRFARMLLNGGELDGERILATGPVAEMTTDQIGSAEKSAWPSYAPFLGTNGWGYGVAVVTGPDDMGHDPGTYGWMGGLGTVWDNNPRRNLAGVMLVQRELRGPHDLEIATAFWKNAYAALAD